MSDAETIKEFLVKLGFKVDETSFKKFDEATGLSTKNVAAFGLGVTAAAAATEAFVAKIASGLDKLYFASKRTGTAAGEINAFSYAAEQLGSTAEEAQGALEGLAQFMATRPGAGGLLTSGLFGVNPNDFGNKAKMFNEMFAKWRQLTAEGKGAVAWQAAQQIPGMTWHLFQAGLSGDDFFAKQEQYKAMLKGQGIDLDDAAKKGMAFHNQLDTLERSFELMADSLAGHLIPYMRNLNDWILKVTSKGIDGATQYNGIADWYNQRGITGMLMDSFMRGAGMMDSGAAGGLFKSGYIGLKNLYTSGHMATYIKAHGETSAIAAAMAAQFMAESSGNASAVNGSHYGLGQWDARRQADFKAFTGHDIHGSTPEEQMQFAIYELHGKYKKVYDKLGSDPARNADILNRLYEVSSNDPATLAKNSVLRGSAASQIYNQQGSGTTNFTYNAPTTVNTSGDGQAAGASVAFAHKQTFSDAVRQLNSVVQ